ncbi:MAG: GNAT family N-acetyltransferase [Terracidiphilus sp.]|jgi:RimJ/RimL family protein N-acetyltransferase
MTPTGQTARLILKPLALEDAPQIQALFPQWEIVRYLKNIVPWPYPPDGALAYIRDIALPAIERGGQWIWNLRLKSAPDQIIGSITLTDRETDHRGFWLDPAWRGQGLMTEACVWINDFWFDTLSKPVLRVSKAVPNRASIRVSERMGMRLAGRGEKDYVSGRFPSEIYEITAEEWREWKAGRNGPA